MMSVGGDLGRRTRAQRISGIEVIAPQTSRLFLVLLMLGDALLLGIDSPLKALLFNLRRASHEPFLDRREKNHRAECSSSTPRPPLLLRTHSLHQPLSLHVAGPANERLLRSREEHGCRFKLVAAALIRAEATTGDAAVALSTTPDPRRGRFLLEREKIRK